MAQQHVPMEAIFFNFFEKKPSQRNFQINATLLWRDVLMKEGLIRTAKVLTFAGRKINQKTSPH
jgi:hypothetical protein